MHYYLIDLERSVSSRLVHYWRANRHGYTPVVSEAGLYSLEVAQEIVDGDVDKRTVMVGEDVVNKILKRS